MKIVDLKGKSDANDYGAISPSDPPDYPYGLKLQLNDDTLAALGITELPPPGTQVIIEARAIVEMASVPVGNMLEGPSMCVQIVAMGLDIPRTPRSPGAKVYGDNDG